MTTAAARWLFDDPVFSSYDAVALTGVTYRQLDYYARTGLVTATVPAQGSGSSRRYTLRELTMLAVAARLAPSFGAHHRMDVTQRALDTIRRCPAGELADLETTVCDRDHTEPGGTHHGCPVTVTVRTAPLVDQILSAHNSLTAVQTRRPAASGGG